MTHNGAADPDGDGASNLAELRAGTDPLDPASQLRVSVTRTGSGTATLGFEHAANRRYAIEFTENVTAWTALTNLPVFDLSQGVVNWTDKAPDATRRFYRIRAE
ncbi:MAG: thrombospondin type 3 repeat-containing protein [Verrucomicrobia subdivision 3 bacterium]|nr:thrombospondin type 3 repeat-containing protein [Limisphaerales bacterium]